MAQCWKHEHVAMKRYVTVCEQFVSDAHTEDEDEPTVAELLEEANRNLSETQMPPLEKALN